MRVVVVLAAVAALALSATAAATTGPPHVDQVWIVTLDEDHPSQQHAPALVRRHGGELQHVYSHALNGFAFHGSEKAAQGLARNPAVVSIEADRPVHATDHTTPTGVTRIGAPEAHDEGHTGQGVKIAILDTGIDASHPALDVDTMLGKDCTGSGSTDDGNSHGTHVAGTASAAVVGSSFVGAATAATVVPVKVLNNSGSGTWASVICGIDHVTEHEAAIRIANMSLSGSGTAGSSCSSSSLRKAICESVAAGIVYTVAAGNNGADVANSVPAAYPEVITVSALDENRCVRFVGGGPARTECGEGLASFSNYGAGVDVIAPGVSIYSTVPGGYGTKSGTSMAAPHVAGVAALMLSADPSLKPDEVTALLQSTGECPNGQENDALSGNCDGQGTWFRDPDNFTEPLINAPGAAKAAGDPPNGGEPSNQPPTASFTFACTDLACDFDGSGSSDDSSITGHEWDFGDGKSGNGVTVSHTYDEGGTYTVTLTVTDDEGATDTTSESVTVSAESGSEAGTVTVAGISYSTHGGRTNDRHLSVTVTLHDEDGAVVSGAAVSIDLSRDDAPYAVATDTTGSDGAVTFGFNNAPSGTYVTTVTSVVADDHEWDGSPGEDDGFTK